MTFLYVCLGAAIGAPVRYLADRAIQARFDPVLPWGTLVVNVVGSLALGALTGLAGGHDVPGEVSLLVGTGLCGALTTYSTFGYETVRLVAVGARLYALVNVGVAVTTGFAAALGGYALGTAV